MVRDAVQAKWDEIWDLLEAGDSDAAAARALEALNEADDVPEYHYLLGLALLDLAEVEAAAGPLERAVELDADWADAHAALAWSYFRACRFDEAKPAAARALGGDEKLAEVHQLLGLLAEREGEDDAALLAFAEATRLDPDRFPPPIEISEDEFQTIAEQVVAELDEELREVLEETALFIQPVPSDELLHGADPPLDPQILGLFLGRSLLEQTSSDSGTLPNTMYLFQRNLERSVTSREELEEEIRITALHEIGHHFGWDEDDLAERGLA